MGINVIYMAKVANSVLNHSQLGQSKRYGQPQLTLREAQEDIFSFLLDIVRQWAVEDVLEQFQQMFFEYGETASSEVSSALYTLLISNNEQEFHNTLKRSCYILVNNWEVAREYQAVQTLMQLFDDPHLLRRTFSPTLRRLREWVLNFIDSHDYKELQLFANRFSAEAQPLQWSSRYTPYLLVSQYVNTENPVEQREAARVLSKRLKDKFKLDLAMYTAHSQHSPHFHRHPKNPTTLGNSVLRLIKAIVARKGRFSYKNLAHLFLEQVKGLSYSNFKKSLLEYLAYSINQPDVVKVLRQQLGAKLDTLYSEYNSDVVDPSLQLRTCNRVIDYLMTEDRRSPSSLFTLLISQGKSISLAILLLKLVLISPNSRQYLEARIADIVRYYEQFPKDRCTWIINFLEVFQVTFAIYAENVEYDLVLTEPQGNPEFNAQGELRATENLEACRIFSRMVLEHDDDGMSRLQNAPASLEEE